MNFFTRHPLGNSNGITMAEIVISLGLAATAVFAMSGILLQAGSAYHQQQALQGVEEAVREFQNQVYDSCSWSNMVQHAENTSLACLKNGQSCAAQSGSFMILDRNNGVLYDPVTPGSDGQNHAGIDRQGRPCLGFDPDVPVSRCPFRVNVEWESHCSNLDPNCLRPEIEVALSVQVPDNSPTSLAVAEKVSIRMRKMAKPVYPTCDEALVQNAQKPGRYLVDSDGVGFGNCPEEVSCGS